MLIVHIYCSSFGRRPDNICLIKNEPAECNRDKKDKSKGKKARFSVLWVTSIQRDDAGIGTLTGIKFEKMESSWKCDSEINGRLTTIDFTRFHHYIVSNPAQEEVKVQSSSVIGKGFLLPLDQRKLMSKPVENAKFLFQLLDHCLKR